MCLVRVRAGDVPDSDVLRLALIGELLHRLPRLLERHIVFTPRSAPRNHICGAKRLTRVYLAVEAPPLGRVLVLRVNVLEADGEVHEEEVKVVDAPEPELLLREDLGLQWTSSYRASGAKAERAWRRRTCSYLWYVFQS